jgi:hypothetical protein
MSPEAQRIAIATALGWHNIQPNPIGATPLAGSREASPHDGAIFGIPNYLSDLNACMELCNRLAEQGWNCQLANGLDGTWECEFMRPPIEATDGDDIGSRHGERLEIHYGTGDTAAKAVCETFLRTLNLWDDSK